MAFGNRPAPREVRHDGRLAKAVRYLPLSVHLLSLVAGAVALSVLARGTWFFGDEWDFIAQRSVSFRSLFTPHNEHWSTLPILGYRALVNTVGLHSYWPFLAMLFVVHLALAHVLWRVCIASGASPWIATATVAVFVFLGAGYENLFWAFQVGFIGSVLFGWAAVLAALPGRAPYRLPARRYAGTWALCLASLMCSGIGVVMTGVLLVAVMLRRGPREALKTSAVPLPLFVLWYLTFGRFAHRLPGPRNWSLWPTYVSHGMLNVIGKAFATPQLELPVLGIIVAWAVAHIKSSRAEPAPAFAGLLGLPALFGLIGIGRIPLGVSEAAAPRYVYLGAALCLPMVSLVLSARPQGRAGLRRLAAGAALASLAWIGYSNVTQLASGAAVRIALDAGPKARIEGAIDLLRAHRPILAAKPDPDRSPNLTIAELLTMLRRGVLPTPPANSRRVDVLAAEAELQTVVLARPIGMVAPSSILEAHSPVKLERADSCVTIWPVSSGRAQIEVKPAARIVHLTLLSTSGGPLEVSVGGGLASPRWGMPALFRLPAGMAVAFESVVQGEALNLVLPGRVTRICGFT